MKGFITRSVHGSKGSLQKKDPHRALKMPVYETSAYEFESSQDIEKAFNGQKPAHAYSRVSNPTVAELEDRLADLAEASGCLCVSSGMAAVSAVFLDLCQKGDSIVTTRYLFGNTFGLFENTLRPFGVDIRYADMEDIPSLERLIDDSTKAVFLENISNPLLKVFDIKKIADVAASKGALLILDNTLLTPYLFSCRDAGADIEILSNTKSISGGGTGIGGAVLSYDQGHWNAESGPDGLSYIKKLRKNTYRNLGSCLSPFSASMQLLGLETLALRVDRACENALAIHDFLSQRKEVLSVCYPGSPSSPYNRLLREQYKGRSGALLVFELKDREDCFTFMNHLEIIRRATNFCDNKSLIIHPASTIFCEYSTAEREQMGISDSLIRLSVGIEEFADLKDDLNRAFKALNEGSSL